jgi:hypothetical protein
MKVLKATKTQYNSLNGYENGLSKLEFAKDGNDNWIVGIEVLTDTDFETIRTQLNELEHIEYKELKNE